MKNFLLLLLFLFLFSATFAQPIDECDEYSKANIEIAFNKWAYPNDPVPDTFYLVHSFFADNEQGMLDYAKWARENGYQTLQKEITYIYGINEHVRDAYKLSVEKKLDAKNIAELENDVSILVAKRKELNLEQCNGTQLYSYKSRIKSHRFPAKDPTLDSCESYNKEGIENFYNNYIISKKVKADTLYFSHSFKIPSEKIMFEFIEWASANGFQTQHWKMETTIGVNEIDYSYNLILEKKLGPITLDDFEKEMNLVISKRRVLNADECYGTVLSISPLSMAERSKKIKK